MDLRSTWRRANTDAADSEPRTREVTVTDFQSTRRQTNTETDHTEPYSHESNADDRQSTRRQRNVESQNDDTISQDLSNDKNSPQENDDCVVGSPRGGKYNLRPNPTPNITDEYRYWSEQVKSLAHSIFYRNPNSFCRLNLTFNFPFFLLN